MLMPDLFLKTQDNWLDFKMQAAQMVKFSEEARVL